MTITDEIVTEEDRLSQLKNIPAIIRFIRDDIAVELEPTSDDFWKLMDVIYALKNIHNTIEKKKNLKLGRRCRVTANEKASEKTNEMINHHNQPFVIGRKDFITGELLFRTDDQMFIWLPIEEINIQDYE